MFLVDTNVPSELTKEVPDPRVSRFLKITPREHLYLSVITIGEIRKGIELLPSGKKRASLQFWLEFEVPEWFQCRILPVSQPIADRWGKLAAAAKTKGISLPVADALIAATALQHQLTLVTRNTKDFLLPGLDILNLWESL